MEQIYKFTIYYIFLLFFLAVSCAHTHYLCFAIFFSEMNSKPCVSFTKQSIPYKHNEQETDTHTQTAGHAYSRIHIRCVSNRTPSDIQCIQTIQCQLYAYNTTIFNWQNHWGNTNVYMHECSVVCLLCRWLGLHRTWLSFFLLVFHAYFDFLCFHSTNTVPIRSRRFRVKFDFIFRMERILFFDIYARWIIQVLISTFRFHIS